MVVGIWCGGRVLMLRQSYRPGNREVVAAGFLAPGQALRDPDLPPHISTYLDARAAAVAP
ncbi:hypothetical protein ACFQS7_15730 [Dankookia sp. GCM10030260]|uniref:hypothetical protein n=1 Tax=Dankookia sp. GCM10030260 TaxID=3273390 RepID=UPI00361792A2